MLSLGLDVGWLFEVGILYLFIFLVGGVVLYVSLLLFFDENWMIHTCEVKLVSLFFGFFSSLSLMTFLFQF